MDHRNHEYVAFAQARNSIKKEVQKIIKISEEKEKKLKQAQQSLCSKLEEVSSNKVSILGVVDSTFKEVQSKLCEHRQRIENQIQRQSNAEKEKIEVYIKRNFQESLKELVSFCENILSNRSDLEVVYFLDDMKLSLLKCSNSNEEEYQSSLQRLRS